MKLIQRKAMQEGALYPEDAIVSYGSILSFPSIRERYLAIRVNGLLQIFLASGCYGRKESRAVRGYISVGQGSWRMHWHRHNTFAGYKWERVRPMLGDWG